MKRPGHSNSTEEICKECTVNLNGGPHRGPVRGGAEGDLAQVALIWGFRKENRERKRQPITPSPPKLKISTGPLPQGIVACG